MPVAAIAAVGGIASSIIGGNAAKKAARVQAASQDAALAQNQRQFDTTRADYAPFREAGANALGQQSALAGAGGAEAQQAAINGVQASPYFQSLMRNGTENVLQNASATGGLRGGNTQASLYNVGNDALAQAIQTQIGNLGGISQLGAGVTTNGAQLGQQNANAAGQFLTNKGTAQSQGALANGAMWSNAINQGTSLFGKFFGGGFGGGGGGMAGLGGAAIAPFAGSAPFSAAFGSGGGGLSGGSGYQAPTNYFGGR